MTQVQQAELGAAPPVRVVIDARLTSRVAGGVETVIIGLASGLSRLTDSADEYIFLTTRDSDWLRPYVSEPAKILATALETQSPSRVRRSVSQAAPWLRSAWRRLPALGPVGIRSPRLSDGTVERLGADVVHLPIQDGFVTDIPTIYHPHDLQHVHLPGFFSPRERAQRDRIYGTLCRRAALVAVTSTWSAQDVIEHYGLRTEKVTVIEWAPILSEYPPSSVNAKVRLRAELGLPDAFIFYPAQTWPHKNHEALFHAIATLRRVNQLAVPLVLSGHETTFAGGLRRLASDIGIADLVHWLGFVSPATLRAIYDMATSVVVPSRFEAASGPLWEAFVAGTPAACSNVTSLPRQAGDAALVFDPDDVNGLAAIIKRLWTEPDLRRELAQRGRRNVARFTWDRTARKFRAHYRRLAGRVLGPEDAILVTEPPIL
jgi:glycosyltransferase involved in cell wall biosynthesis